MTNDSLIQFVESITTAGGVYADLNGHSIVADAYRALRQHEADTNSSLCNHYPEKCIQTVKNGSSSEISDASAYGIKRAMGDAIKSSVSVQRGKTWESTFSADDVAADVYDVIRPYLHRTEPEVDTIHHLSTCYDRVDCRCPRTYKPLKPQYVGNHLSSCPQITGGFDCTCGDKFGASKPVSISLNDVCGSGQFFTRFGPLSNREKTIVKYFLDAAKVPYVD